MVVLGIGLGCSSQDGDGNDPGDCPAAPSGYTNPNEITKTDTMLSCRYEKSSGNASMSDECLPKEGWTFRASAASGSLLTCNWTKADGNGDGGDSDGGATLSYRGTCSLRPNINFCFDAYGGGGDLTMDECDGNTSRTKCTGSQAGTCRYRDGDGRDAEYRFFSGDATSISSFQRICEAPRGGGTDGALGGTWTPADDGGDSDPPSPPPPTDPGTDTPPTHRGTCDLRPGFDLCIDYFGEGGALTTDECFGTTGTTMCTGSEVGTCSYQDSNGEEAEFKLFGTHTTSIATFQGRCTGTGEGDVGGMWTPAGS